MGLPILKHPVFSLVLPSTKQKVEFRPFLVKEEKILLIAQSSGEQADVVRAIKQVISNCITTPDVDVNKFTTFDLEYFFIKLRSKSVQNIITVSYRDNEDEKIYDIDINLDDIECIQDAQVSDTIILENGSTIKLRYPQIKIMDDVEDITEPAEFNFAIMQSCIDSITSEGYVYNSDEYSSKEVREFLDSLDVKSYQQIQEFIDAMPRIEHTVAYTNTNGKEVKIVLKTLTDFFTLG